MAEDLRERIASGELASGSVLPGELELAERYHLSRTSVRNAIRQLREWGLVRVERGRGTYVRAPRERVTRYNAERYQWEKDRVRKSEEERRSTGGVEFDTGLTVADLTFHAEYGELRADEDLAGAFGAPVGTRLLRRVYWTRPGTDTAPLSLARSYLPYDLAARNPELLDAGNEPWPGGTQHQLATVGVEVDRIEERVTARPPLPDEADRLDVEPGVSVLAVRRVSLDVEGRVVEVVDAVYPGDRIELVYPIQLRRWNGAGERWS